LKGTNEDDLMEQEPSEVSGELEVFIGKSARAVIVPRYEAVEAGKSKTSGKRRVPTTKIGSKRENKKACRLSENLQIQY
jgi:hypothetical protein